MLLASTVQPFEEQAFHLKEELLNPPLVVTDRKVVQVTLDHTLDPHQKTRMMPVPPNVILEIGQLLSEPHRACPSLHSPEMAPLHATPGLAPDVHEPKKTECRHAFPTLGMGGGFASAADNDFGFPVVDSYPEFAES